MIINPQISINPNKAKDMSLNTQQVRTNVKTPLLQDSGAPQPVEPKPSRPVPGNAFHPGLLFGENSKSNYNASSRLIVPGIGRRPKTKSNIAVEDAIQKMELAAEKLGLDNYPVWFYELDLDKYFQVIARGGYMNRPAHWSFGQKYHELILPHLQGYAQFYESVTNTLPSKAMLLDTVPLHGKKTIIAHAIARSDFYKNNVHFKHTDPNFDIKLQVHRDNIEDYYNKKGRDDVEAFIDKTLMVKDLIDNDTTKPQDDLIKPIEPTPDNPGRDVMGFLIQQAPNLTPEQREILSMTRDESYHVMPQRKTNVISDGWAAFVNRKINTRNPDLRDTSNIVNEARWITNNIFKVKQTEVNTYMLGETIFRDIERKLIKEYGENSPKIMEGLLEARAKHDNKSLIQEHFSKEILEEILLHTNTQVDDKIVIGSKEVEQVRDTLIQQFEDNDDGAIPTVVVANKNHKDKGYLLLRNESKFPLEANWAEEVLKTIEVFWGKAVYLETSIRDSEGEIHPVYVRSRNLGTIDYVNADDQRLNPQTGKPVRNTPNTSGGVLPGFPF